MIKATLQFMSLDHLWKFKTRVHTPNMTILEKLNLLIAELPEEEIDFACFAYGASVVRKQRLLTDLLGVKAVDQ